MSGEAAASAKRQETLARTRLLPRVAFDTSVLVAATLKDHQHHTAAASWMRRAEAGSIEGVIAAHTLAETYCVLTTYPAQPRMSPAMALQMIASLERRFRVVALSAGDYTDVMSVLAGAGLSGGIIYDALGMRGAAKGGAESVLTFNRRDFERLEALFKVRVQLLSA